MSPLKINEQVQAAIDASARLAALASPSADPIAAARNAYRQLVPLAGEPEPVHTIKNYLIETSGYSIPVRIYNPSGGHNLPAVVFFHGGWFFGGDLETHDRPLRALANASGCIVVAVDYRLAPEHPFPAALEDGYAVLQWAANDGTSFGINRDQIIIAGDSAGGNIATVLARKAAQNNDPRILLQVLLYPVTDPSLNTQSWQEFKDGPVITREIAQQAWDMYVPDASQRNNADTSPILSANLTGSAPARVIVAEYDPLRDEGIAYAVLLEKAGVKVTTRIYKQMPHGFFQMGGYIDEGKNVINETANAIKDILKT